MNAAVWIAIIGAAAWIPGIWGIIEAVKKRRKDAAHADDEADRMVVQSAVQLLAPYRQEVAELKTKLGEATVTIEKMKTELDTANQRAKNLAEELQSAQAEVGYLRVQVTALTKQMPGGS